MTPTDNKPAEPTLAPPAPPAVAPARKPKKFPETTEGLPWASSHEIKKEPNAFIDTDWYNRTYAWAGMLVRFVIIFGALFSVVQYVSVRTEKKVERTLQLVDLWETPEYGTAQTAINTKLAELNASNNAFYPKDGSDAEKAAYFSRIGKQSAQDAAVEEHINKVIYFLNRLAFCVEGSLCSDDIADAYFRDYAISFWQYFAGYVGDRRQTSPNFARPLEDYVRGLQASGP